MYSLEMRDFKVDRLSDEFGQYEIFLQCPCGHERRCRPETLARIAGWDARLEAVARRMRCSKCARRGCRVRVVALAAGRAADGARRGPGVR